MVRLVIYRLRLLQVVGLSSLINWVSLHGLEFLAPENDTNYVLVTDEAISVLLSNDSPLLAFWDQL